MIILECKSNSKTVNEAQEKIKSVISSFYKDNFDNLCIMNDQKVEEDICSLLSSNNYEALTVYFCKPWDNELMQYSYLKKGERLDDNNFYVEYKNLHINGQTAVGEIVVAFRCKGLKNNYLITFLVEINTFLKQELSLKLSNVNEMISI